MYINKIIGCTASDYDELRDNVDWQNAFALQFAFRIFDTVEEVQDECRLGNLAAMLVNAHETRQHPCDCLFINSICEDCLILSKKEKRDHSAWQAVAHAIGGSYGTQSVRSIIYDHSNLEQEESERRGVIMIGWTEQVSMKFYLHTMINWKKAFRIPFEFKWFETDRHLQNAYRRKEVQATILGHDHRYHFIVQRREHPACTAVAAAISGSFRRLDHYK